MRIEDVEIGETYMLVGVEGGPRAVMVVGLNEAAVIVSDGQSYWPHMLEPIDPAEWFVWPDGECQRWEDMTAHDAWCAAWWDGVPQAACCQAREVADGHEHAKRQVEHLLGSWQVGADEALAARDHFRQQARPLELPTATITVYGTTFPIRSVSAFTMDSEARPDTIISQATFDALETQDAPSYGGWSEGDVLEYLSRYDLSVRPERRGTPPHDGWVIHSNPFNGYVWYRETPSRVCEAGWVIYIGGFERGGFACLEDGMRWAFEKWSRWVSEKSFYVPERDNSAPEDASKPVTFPSGITPVHVGTGDMGQHTAWAGGWHDAWDE